MAILPIVSKEQEELLNQVRNQVQQPPPPPTKPLSEEEEKRSRMSPAVQRATRPAVPELFESREPKGFDIKGAFQHAEKRMQGIEDFLPGVPFVDIGSPVSEIFGAMDLLSATAGGYISDIATMGLRALPTIDEDDIVGEQARDFGDLKPVDVFMRQSRRAGLHRIVTEALLPVVGLANWMKKLGTIKSLDELDEISKAARFNTKAERLTFETQVEKIRKMRPDQLAKRVAKAEEAAKKAGEIAEQDLATARRQSGESMVQYLKRVQAGPQALPPGVGGGRTAPITSEALRKLRLKRLIEHPDKFERTRASLGPDLMPRTSKGAIIAGGFRHLANIIDPKTLTQDRVAWGHISDIFDQIEDLSMVQLRNIGPKWRAQLSAKSPELVVSSPRTKQDVFRLMFQSAKNELHLTDEVIESMVNAKPRDLSAHVRQQIVNAQEQLRAQELASRATTPNQFFDPAELKVFRSMRNRLHRLNRTLAAAKKGEDVEDIQVEYDELLRAFDVASNKTEVVVGTASTGRLFPPIKVGEEALRRERAGGIASARRADDSLPGIDPVDPGTSARPSDSVVGKDATLRLLDNYFPGLAKADDAPLGTTAEHAAETAKISTRTGRAPRGEAGVPTGEVREPYFQPSPETAAAELNDLLTTPIGTNVVDIAATEAIKAAPRGGRAMATAMANARKGKEIEIEDIVNTAPFNAITKIWDLMVMDPTRIMQHMDMGMSKVANVLQRGILWPIRRLQQAQFRYNAAQLDVFSGLLDKYKFGTLTVRSSLVNKTTDVMEHMGSKVVDADVSALLDIPAIQKITKGLSTDEAQRVVGFAQDLRKFLDDQLDQVNMVRRARGQKEIAKRENYVPHLVQWNLMRRFAGHDVIDVLQKEGFDITTPVPMPDFISRVSKHVNARALPRTGALQAEKLERDIIKLIEGYIDSSSRDIFFEDIIRNTRKHTNALRVRSALPSGNPHKGDFNVVAKGIDDWVNEAFLNHTPKIDEVVSSIPVIGSAFRERLLSFLTARRWLNRSVFALNPMWNLFIQTSSVANTLLRYGTKNTFLGIDYLTSPTARKWVRNNVYSAEVKQRRGGRLAYQDLAESSSISLSLRGAPLDTLTDRLNFLTNLIEDNLTGISIRAAHHHGTAQGLKGRALLEYASDGGAKTQSMYNIHDRAGVLRSQVLQAMVPFQTFSVEMYNTFREFLPLGRRGAIPLGTRIQRYRNFMAFTAALVTWNMVGDKVIDRKPWVLSSFVPFFQVVTGLADSENTMRSGSLPGAMGKDFTRALNDIRRYDNPKKLYRFLRRYFMIGGIQLDRTYEGMWAVAHGNVEDIQEREKFKIDTDSVVDKFRARAMGPYATEEGREFVKDIRKRRGPYAEMLGVPIPPRWSTDTELNDLESRFGEIVMFDEDEQTEQGKPFSPADFAKRARWTRIKVSPGRFRDEVGPLGQMFLDYEKRADAFDKKYRTATSQKRMVILRADPELDAWFVFWGRRTTVQTPIAINFLRQWMETYNVPAEVLPPFGSLMR